MHQPIPPASERAPRAPGFRVGTRLLCDTLAVVLAFGFCFLLYSWAISRGFLLRDLPQPNSYLIVTIGFASLLALVFWRLGLYQPRASVLDLWELRTALRGLILAAAYLFAGLFFLKLEGYSRLVVVGAIGLASVLVFLERRWLAGLIPALQRKSGSPRRVLIYGAGPTGRLIMKKIVQTPSAGWTVVGFVDDAARVGEVVRCRVSATGPVVAEAPVLGGWADWLRLATKHGVTELLVVSSAATPAILREALELSQDGAVHVGIIPELGDVRADRLQVDDLDAIPVLRAAASESTGWTRATKRIFDLVGGTLLLLASLPILLLSALLIRLGSRGPIFFVQDRVGLNGRIFRMVKFRTMHRDTDPFAPSPRGNVDPRITRIGRLLRISCIDELPQVFNVLGGNMSLVGPRPEMPFIVEQYTPLERQRLRVKPGITGLWQLSADRHVEIHDNLEYDLHYIASQSVLTDFVILFQTLIFVAGQIVRLIFVPRPRRAELERPADLSATPRATERIQP